LQDLATSRLQICVSSIREAVARRLSHPCFSCPLTLFSEILILGKRIVKICNRVNAMYITEIRGTHFTGNRYSTTYKRDIKKLNAQYWRILLVGLNYTVV
jgi:hypothetical protein